MKKFSNESWSRRSGVRRSGVRRPSVRSRGFTFLEVLFAVIILGIGFIMLAGMFPVAISQQQASLEETQGPLITTTAAAKLNSIFRNPQLPLGGPDPFPPTGNSTVAPGPLPKFVFRSAVGTDQGSLWIAANQVSTVDPSYAWVLFYSRDIDKVTTKGATSATVLIVPVRNRNFPQYQLTDPSLDAQTVTLKKIVLSGAAQPFDTLQFATPVSAALTSGAWVIVGDDSANGGATNGMCFQLGNQVKGTTDTWELIPGRDFTSYPPRFQPQVPPAVPTKVSTIVNAGGFVVGRGIDSYNPSLRSGQAQEIGVPPLLATITLPPPPP